MTKDIMLVTGAGQISMAIARPHGICKKIVLGDRSLDNAKAIAKTLTEAGFDVVTFEMDLSSCQSIKEMMLMRKLLVTLSIWLMVRVFRHRKLRLQPC